MNIGSVVDVEEVAEFAKTLPNVVYTSTSVFSCSDAGQQEIKEAIKDYNLNRIVVAACTPMIHEGTYRALLKEAGLSPYYFQMVNLREHNSFVHTDKEAATEKAKRLVAAGVARAELLEDIPVMELETVEAVMVVGAGITGMTTALDLAKQGIKVYLVESSSSIGGSMAKFDRVFPTDDCSI